MRGLLIALMAATPAMAQEAPASTPAAEAKVDPLVVGVYAPRVYFANSLARTAFANEIARQLGAATGQPMAGRGFATRGDFDAQVGAGRVHFAVVEAQLQAQRGFTALAQGTSGGKSSKAMVLVVSPKAPAAIGGLQGRSLATVTVSKGDRAFEMNYLLQGQVPPDWFKAKRARDAQSALNLVRLGKADAAFTFAGATGGLPVAFTSRAAPLPVFVQTDRTLSPAVVAKVRGAIGGVRANHSVFGSFGGYDAGGIKRLAGSLKGGPRRPGTEPVIAPGRPRLPSVPEFLADGPLPLAMPPPSAGMLVPDPPGDAF